MKGAAYCSFRIALSNRYFGKVLLIRSVRAWNNFFKYCISAEFLLMQGYVQGTLRKELLIAPFVERFKTATLRKVSVVTFISTSNKIPKHCIFAKFFLIEGKV